MARSTRSTWPAAHWTRLPYQRGAGDTDLSPMYSPDGRWIAFHRNVSVSDLWRVPATGGTPERLTDLRTNIYSLAWAPDGKSIVFGRYLDGNVSLRAPTCKAAGQRPRHPQHRVPVASPRTHRRRLRHHRSAFGDLQHGPGPDAAMPSRLPVFPRPASTCCRRSRRTGPDGIRLRPFGPVGVWWARTGAARIAAPDRGVIPVPRYAPVWSADSSADAGDRAHRHATAALFEVLRRAAACSTCRCRPASLSTRNTCRTPSRILVVADRGAGRLAVTLYDRCATPWNAIAYARGCLPGPARSCAQPHPLHPRRRFRACGRPT